MISTPTGRAWSEVVDATMRDRPGVWGLLRGGYAYLLIPELLVVLAGLLVLVHRHRGSRAAWVLGAVALASNLTVQFVKLAPLGIEQNPTALDPLSGHVGVAAGVCLGWLVVAPPLWRARSAVATAAVLVAVTSGVLLAGWHSPFQLLCPLLMATGWAVVGAAALSVEASAPDGESRLRNGHGRAPLVSGLLVVAGTSFVVFRFQDALLQPGVAPVVLAVLWISGWCAAAVGCLVQVTSLVRQSSAGSSLDEPPR
jgi:hypothetical protein